MEISKETTFYRYWARLTLDVKGAQKVFFNSHAICINKHGEVCSKIMVTQKIIYSIIKMKVIKEHDTAFEENKQSCI